MKFIRALMLRIGRRGAFLLFLSVLFICYGAALLDVEVRALQHIVNPNFFLSLHTWGWVWIGTGIIIATGILSKKDIPQFTVSALMMAIWGGLYVDLWAVQHVPDSWISVIIWLAFAMTVVVISGWPEPSFARDIVKATNGNSTTHTAEQVIEEAIRDTSIPSEGEGE